MCHRPASRRACRPATMHRQHIHMNREREKDRKKEKMFRHAHTCIDTPHTYQTQIYTNACARTHIHTLKHRERETQKK